MQLEQQSFDRNWVFLDASSTLFKMRKESYHPHTWRTITTKSQKKVTHYFPRIWKQSAHILQEYQEYWLIFFHLPQNLRAQWKDIHVEGRSSIFIISSVAPYSEWHTPGNCIHLKAGEKYLLKYEDFSGHFVGIAKDEAGKILFNI